MKETMTDLLQRRSCKNFKPDMIPQEVLDQILEAGTFAANGHGNQAGLMIAITNRELRDKLSAKNAEILGAKLDPFYGAPVCIAVLAEKKIPTHVYDGSLVLGNLMTAAYALGIGSCWIHRAKETFESEMGQEILRQVGIEGDYEGIGFCVLGYENGEPRTAAPRKANFIYRVD